MATKAYIEAQIPILQASSARLTALEISGIAVASVLALTILKGLLGSNKVREPTEAEVAAATEATLARVEALGLGQVVTTMSVSSLMSTIQEVSKLQAGALTESSCAHPPSPGSMIALFRGSPGSVSTSVRVLLDFPWSADVVAAEERAQSLKVLTELDGAVNAPEEGQKQGRITL